MRVPYLLACWLVLGCLLVSDEVRDLFLYEHTVGAERIGEALEESGQSARRTRGTTTATRPPARGGQARGGERQRASDSILPRGPFPDDE